MDERKVTFSNGTFIVYKNKVRHSVYGPAFLSPWTMGWYIDGEPLIPSEWAKRTKTSKKDMNLLIEKYEKYQKEILFEHTLTRK